MRITIGLGERSYPVLIDEPGSLAAYVKRHVAASGYAIVTNDTLAQMYREAIDQWTKELGATLITIADGEQYKTIDTWRGVLDNLLGAKLDRKAVVIAFGGGVLGDIVGFAAASFLRGVRFVQVPTTLLAMVDSSVGGKTGVNHPAGKNLIGAFHQPSAVWAQLSFLGTLSKREFVCGYAEAFKYGFIGGRSMADFIHDNHAGILAREAKPLQEAIRRSVAIKADIVSRDEREAGVRALLNFGHTFGHSIEKFCNYRGILHGEAVFWGMACAIDLGLRMDLISKTDRAWFEAMRGLLRYPPLPKAPDFDALYAGMFSDKKVEAGKLRLILPTTPGESIIRDNIPEQAIRETLRAVFARKGDE